MADMTFVNPYNFVPFPKEVRRRRAWGHTGPGQVGEGEWFANDVPEPLYSGTIDVEWQLVTPLQLPPNAVNEWLNGNVVRIPGSSIKGVTRSVHEAMFNGCARIFDEEFVPGYRMPATPWPLDQDPEWCLAQVVAASDGRPRRLRLTEDVTFVSAARLKNLMTWRPTTGDVVSIRLDAANERQFPMGFQRFELDPAAVGPASPRAHIEAAIAADQSDAAMDDPDACVFIITDTKVRGRHPARWATARLIDDYHEISDRDTKAWDDFIRSVAGSDDLRTALGGQHYPQWRQAPQHVTVDQDGQILGRRTLQTGRLFVGDVVWVRTAGQDDERHIVEFRLSQIWRQPGGVMTTGERAPGVHACHPTAEGDGLCLSCATFGSIDARRTNQSDGRSVGYRGHVQFSSVTAREVTTTTVTRAPLSSPKPGAGMFHLRGLATEQQRSVGDIAAHWGSEADPGAPLRGRTFYWHSDPDEQHAHWSNHGARHSQPRYRAAPQQPQAEPGVRLVLPAHHTVFTGTVAVDRLPMPALQALLASLSPQRLAGAFESHAHRRTAVHLGGGKPLGLGTAVPRVAGLSISKTSSRYQGNKRTDVADLGLSAIKRLVDAVGMPPLGELLALLDLNGLSNDERVRVSYPPGAPWTEFGTRGFATSYGFFKARNGQQYERRANPLTPLPEPTAEDRRIEWEGLR